ncbi:hypothetical protein MTO96_021321 [Rhipicephalus appendiculatus]
MTAFAAAFVPTVEPEEVVMTSTASVTATASAVFVPAAVVVGAYVMVAAYMAAVEYAVSAFAVAFVSFPLEECLRLCPEEGYGEKGLDEVTLISSGVSSAE